MKKLSFQFFIVALACSLSINLSSCKGKNKQATAPADTEAISPIDTTAPVEIAADTDLKAGVKDATKDYPQVKAEVLNGEIILTGQIESTKLPALMMTLNSLKPKKINNQLTIK